MFRAKTAIIILITVFVLALGIWLGGSYYIKSTQGDDYLAFLINNDKDDLGKYVRPDFPLRDGNSIYYRYPVKFWSFEEDKNDIIFTLSPSNYGRYTTQDTSEKFEYILSKSTLDTDFNINTLNSGQYIFIEIEYDISQTPKLFFEYARCVAYKEYSKLFKLDNSCARGNCLINRKPKSWDIEILSKDISDKVAYLDSINKEDLVKGLTNNFITEDSGYFDDTQFKYVSRQVGHPDNTYQFESFYFASDTSNSIKAFVPMWFLERVSEQLVSKDEYYKDVDFDKYISNIYGYIDQDSLSKNSFLSCEVASSISTKLKDCNSEVCNTVKSVSRKYCEDSLVRATSTFNSYISGYDGYTTSSFTEGYNFVLPSEMVIYNSLVSSKYTKSDINNYYSKIKEVSLESGDIIPLCYSLKSAKSMYSEYKDNSYLQDMDLIYSKLPEFNNVCSSNRSFCALSPAEKLVCVDALNGYKTDKAYELLSDIFYSHYFLSNGSYKLQTYENLRSFDGDIPWDFPMKDTYSTRYEDYGYMVFNTRYNDLESNFATLIDSYYFIYVLESITK